MSNAALPSLSGSFPDPRLDFSRRDIRIVALQPGLWGEPVVCFQYKASLDDGPAYDALSYVWGDPSACCTVYLNNRVRSVTTNLFAALRRLRHNSQERSLWIDALCIDQDDNDEKAHQVGLMGSIYSQARETLLWLGDYVEDPISIISEGTDDHSSGLLLLSGNLAQHHKVVRAFQLIRLLALDHHFPTRDEGDEAPGPDVVDTRKRPCPKFVAALAMLMEFTWWTRIWTVQEVVLPRAPTVVCGAIQAPWSLFEQAVTNIVRHNEDHECLAGHEPLLIRFYTKVDAIKLARERVSMVETLDIDVLSMFRDRHSRDARDQIFALLGICPPALAAGIVPNYALDHRAIYADAVVKLISYTKALKPLWKPREFHRDQVLPSWVPDWTAQTDPDTSHIEAHRSDLSEPSQYNSSSGRFAAVVHFDPRLGLLVLQGNYVDIIVVHSEAITRSEAGDFATIDPIVKRWWSCFVYSDPYPLGGTYEEAFWRLLCGNRISVQDAAGQRVQKGYGYSVKPEDWQIIREDYDAQSSVRTGLPMILVNRRFFVTHSGLLGLGPVETQTGDTVHILFGGYFPYILRPVVGADQFQFLGEGYVHGIMNGEAVPEGTEGELISLV